MNIDFNYEKEFASLSLKDNRLNTRFIKTMNTLSNDCGSSILKAAGSRTQAKAIYRLFSNESFKFDSVLQSHKESTIKRIKESNNKLILAIQDSTFIDYSGHKKTVGIGSIAHMGLGLKVHSTLAVTPDGLALGLLDQHIWTRHEKIYDKNLTKAQNNWIKEQKPVEEKESINWINSMNHSITNIPNDVKIINVCDRESDFYELFANANEKGISFLIRAAYSRKCSNNEEYSFDLVKKCDVAGYTTITIPRDSRNGIKTRNCQMGVKYTKIDIIKPARIKNKIYPKIVSVNIIYLYETNCEENKDIIEWFLLTNEVINNAADAFRCAGYYVQRWKIERFHYVLKSGCNIEKLELHSCDKLSKAILLYSIISIKIMNITYQARINPDKLCDGILDKEEWKTLYCLANKTNKEPRSPYTVLDAITYLGIIGGYKRAPSDGVPGLEAVWNGLIKLQSIIEYKNYLM